MINRLPTVQSPLQYLLHAPFALLLSLEIILSLYDGLWPKYHLLIKAAMLVLYTIILLGVAIGLIREQRTMKNAANGLDHSRQESEFPKPPETLTYKYVINERPRGQRVQAKRASQNHTIKPGSSSREHLQPSRKFSSFGLMSEVDA